MGYILHLWPCLLRKNNINQSKTTGFWSVSLNVQTNSCKNDPKLTNLTVMGQMKMMPVSHLELWAQYFMTNTCVCVRVSFQRVVGHQQKENEF
jgi:hypothetical protein